MADNRTAADARPDSVLQRQDRFTCLIFGACLIRSGSRMKLLRTARRLIDPSLLPIYWVGLAVIVVEIDFLLGPRIQFPIAFVIPVALAAWYSGWRWGVGLGIVLPLIRLYFVSILEIDGALTYPVINAGIRIAVLCGIAVLLDRLAHRERQLALQVESLEGLLPICSGCKKIRDEHQHWQPLEIYIGQRSKAQFTHGFCPPCAREYFGDFADEAE